MIESPGINDDPMAAERLIRKSEAMAIIVEALNKPHRALASENDNPGNIPAEIEALAIQIFQGETRGLTGIPWDWEESCAEVRNRYRIKAFKRQYTPPSGGRSP